MKIKTERPVRLSAVHPGDIDPELTERNSCIPGDLREVIARQPFFKGMAASHIQLLADAAMEEEFKPGETILEEGDPANRFYIILRGKVMIESETRRHNRIPIQTLSPGDDLGWSWLFPPYYMLFNAHAVEPTKVIFFYATRLREHCEQDPVFGYALMKRVAGAMVRCLNSTREELLALTDLRINPPQPQKT